MRRLLLLFGLLLATAAPALAQTTPGSVHPSFAWSLKANGSIVVNNVQDLSLCDVTIYSGATFGSGTITFQTYGDNGNQAQAVSGVKDLGSIASPAPTQTTTSSGMWTVPVGGATEFAIVLTGATSPSITGWVNCNKGSAAI